MPEKMGYEDLRIYQQAIEGSVLIYKLTMAPELKKEYSLVDQIRRASVSIAANIAEGYGRHSDKDLHHFISISLGSVNEVQTYLTIISKIFPSIKSAELKDFYNGLGKQIYSYRRSLQN